MPHYEIGNDILPWIKYLPIRMGENSELFDGTLIKIADNNIFGMWAISIYYRPWIDYRTNFP